MLTEPQQTSSAEDVQAMPPMVVARVACVALGSALIVYGLRIPVIDRLTSGETPPAESFMAALPPICVGSLFLVLQTHFMRRVWTLIAAQSLSMMLLLVSLATALTEGVGQVALFPLFFAPFAIISIWMTRRQQIAAERAADVPYAVTVDVPPPAVAATDENAPGLKRICASTGSQFQPCEEVVTGEAGESCVPGEWQEPGETSEPVASGDVDLGLDAPAEEPSMDWAGAERRG